MNLGFQRLRILAHWGFIGIFSDFGFRVSGLRGSGFWGALTATVTYCTGTTVAKYDLS